MGMPSDRALARKFHRGDPEALLAIYQRYRDYLLSVAMAMVCDMSRAEDAVHDVFVSLAQTRREFRFRGNLKACLAVSVVNRTRDILRRQSVRAAAPLDPEAEIVSASPAPEQIAVLNEQHRRLAVALGQLPQEHRGNPLR
jgi:RNA polymerase sigma-70 factor (ECF subfamily)